MAKAFALRSGKNLRKQVRRAVCEQMARARAACEDDAESIGERVHVVRASIKKARSLLRLVRPAMSGRCYAAENDELRSISRRLAGFRDADVRPATLEAVLRSCDSSLRASCEPLVQALERARAQATERLVRGQTLRRLKTRLARGARRARRWPITDKSWRAIGRGFVRGGKRVRAAMTQASADGGDEAFHELRKAVKAHAQHVRFIEALSPALHLRRRALDDVAEALGRDHDMAELRNVIEGGSLPTDVSERLVVRVTQRQQALRASLGPKLERLFAERPRTIERRAKRLWRHKKAARATHGDSENSFVASRRRFRARVTAFTPT